MAIICPTVTAYDELAFVQQLNRVVSFIERLHIDFMDGDFTSKASPDFSEVQWPENLSVDIHLMYRQPAKVLDDVIKLRPHLLVIHAEADGNFLDIVDQVNAKDIKIGVALLQKTAVSKIAPVIDKLDHVLVFSGELGSFGGKADLKLLDKVKQLKHLKPDIEIGWDGGINEHNAKRLAAGGVDVLNVGGAIQKADNPGLAYVRLKGMVDEDKNGSN